MPPLDSHSWRQADGYAIARNFLEEDASIFYPRIDHRENFTGITGSEFPLLNYLTYLLYLFTDANWLGGRLINLIVSSFGLFYFYKLIKEHLNPELALTASIVLGASIWFSFSRKFMPDTFSASLMLIGTYHFYNAAKSRLTQSYLLAILFLGLGLLCKISSFVIFAFLMPELLRSLKERSKLFYLVPILLLALLPALLWYFWWVPHLNNTYGLTNFFMGKDSEEAISQLAEDWPKVLKRFYQDAFYYVAFIFMALGVTKLTKTTDKTSHVIALSSLGLLCVYLLKSGFNFGEHTYYIIPVVPVMAYLCAYGLSMIKKEWVKHLVLFFLLCECGINQIHELRMPNTSESFDLRELANKHISESDRVILNTGLNPNFLYISHSKGWTRPEKDFTPESLKNFKQNGADYLFWSKDSSASDSLVKPSQLIGESEYWRIYTLD